MSEPQAEIHPTILRPGGSRLGTGCRHAARLLAVVGLGLLFFWPLLAVYPRPGHAWVFVPLLSRALLPVAALGLGLISIGALLGGPGSPRWRVRLLIAGAPWVVWLLWAAPAMPPGYRALVTFYVPLVWLVTLVHHGVSDRGTDAVSVLPASRRELWFFFVAATLFYTATGIYYTTNCGPRAGDEGYYLIQVDSLHNDGDTDIRNDLGKKISNHISPFSRAPHFYTYHAPGLPFLLAPLYRWGVFGRHLVLGLIAALGLLATVGLCRQLALPRYSTRLVVGLHGLSIYWVVYSSRCLPEVLGASLVAVVFWASARQKEHPWSSAVLAAICTAYLPLANIRFTPLVVGCALFYLGAAVGDARPWRSKLRALAVWALVLVAGGAAVHLYQLSRFEGGFSHPVGHMLFSLPKGAWLALAHYKGITNVYPLYLWLVAANVVWLLRAPTTRWYALGALGLFFGVLITSCMVSDWGGGSTLGGRFLVVTMLVLLPGAAWAWPRCTSAARWTFLMLAGISTGLLAWQLALLPKLGGNFGRPWGELLEVAPGLVGIRYFLAQPSMLIGLAAGVMGLVALPAHRVRTGWALVPLLLGMTAVNHVQAVPIKLFPPYYHDYAAKPSEVAAQLAATSLHRYRWSARTRPQPIDLFSVSDRFYLSAYPTNLLSLYTGPHEGPPAWTVDQSALPPNDWQQRPLSWATLKEPFDPGPGERALLLQGRCEGGVRPQLAVVEGNRTLLETALPVDTAGEVDFTCVVTCRGRGHLYLLMRLEGGPGGFVGHRIAWSPYDSRLFAKAGVTLEARDE